MGSRHIGGCRHIGEVEAYWWGVGILVGCRHIGVV